MRLSWHKRGQKVVRADDKVWTSNIDRQEQPLDFGPRPNKIYTIEKVEERDDGVWLRIDFHLPAYQPWFKANRFRPVYPQIVESLRDIKIETPTPDLETV